MLSIPMILRHKAVLNTHLLAGPLSSSPVELSHSRDTKTLHHSRCDEGLEVRRRRREVARAQPRMIKRNLEGV
jgi:hypothetical protein